MNFFNEPHESIVFKHVLNELGISKKTKKFWDYLFDNVLVKPYFTTEYASNCSKSIEDIYLKQIELAKEYNEDFSDYSIHYKDMIETIISKQITKDTLGDNLENILSLCSKDTFKDVLTKKSSFISNKLSEKLINYFDINELYKMNIVNEELIKEHFNEFDKNLFYELGFKSLSPGFIESYFLDMELLKMSDIDVNLRPNIGLSEVPLYENGGCCIEKRYNNGIGVYIPYGIVSEIFNAIDTGIYSMSEKIDILEKDLINTESCDEEEIDLNTKNYMISNIEYNLNRLKKHRLLLDKFKELKCDI